MLTVKGTPALAVVLGQNSIECMCMLQSTRLKISTANQIIKMLRIGILCVFTLCNQLICQSFLCFMRRIIQALNYFKTTLELRNNNTTTQFKIMDLNKFYIYSLIFKYYVMDSP